MLLHDAAREEELPFLKYVYIALRDVERRPVLCSFKLIEGGSAIRVYHFNRRTHTRPVRAAF